MKSCQKKYCQKYESIEILGFKKIFNGDSICKLEPVEVFLLHFIT